MAEKVFVTGSSGEVGTLLIPILKSNGHEVIALDLNTPPDGSENITKFYNGSVLDKVLLKKIFDDHNPTTVFHLAAILSTGAEKNPELAEQVNAGGTAILMEIVNSHGLKTKQKIKILFPSTIAVYGLPTPEEKNKTKVNEMQFLNPITIYGITKLYCENLGIYYSEHYKMLESGKSGVDFRCVRFPGLISALTLPTGGTSDYAPEIVHTAAKGEAYESFVREDTVLPFMAMPDGIKALISLADAPIEKLTNRIYNVAAFSVSAKQIEEVVTSVFPETTLSYNPDEARQKIVDSWPALIDDSKARADWDWSPNYDFQKAFEEYLIPEIKNRYVGSK